MLPYCSVEGEHGLLPGWLVQIWLQHGMAADFLSRMSPGEVLCLPLARQGQWCAAAVACTAGCRVSCTGHPCLLLDACLHLTTLFCPLASKGRGLALSKSHLHEGGLYVVQGVYGWTWGHTKGLHSSQPLSRHIQRKSLPIETVRAAWRFVRCLTLEAHGAFLLQSCVSGGNRSHSLDKAPAQATTFPECTYLQPGGMASELWRQAPCVIP